MSTYQALLLASPNKIIKNSKNMAIGLIALVVIIVILTSGVLSVTSVNDNNKNADPNPNYVPSLHTQNVINNSLVLNPDGYFFTGFLVPEDASNTVLQGNFTSTANCTNKAVIVTIWSQKDFINYLNGLQTNPCYNRDLMPMVADNLNVSLSSGEYLIVFSSAGVETKTVSVQIDLTYNK